MPGSALNLDSERYLFTGREYQPLFGIQYSRARWYDPNLGRFMSEDPIGFKGGDINLYGYVWNSPQRFTDPTGLSPYDDLKLLDLIWTLTEGNTCQDIAPDFIQGGAGFLGLGGSVTLTRDGDVLAGGDFDLVGWMGNALKDPSKVLSKGNKFGFSGSISSQKILATGRLPRDDRLKILRGDSFQAGAADGFGISGQMNPTDEGNYYSVGPSLGYGVSAGVNRSNPYFRLPISWGAAPPERKGECGCEK